MTYSEEILLDIEGLDKSFGERKVLSGISLKVVKGEAAPPAAEKAPSCDVSMAWNLSRPG